jgi:NAD+ kinase
VRVLLVPNPANPRSVAGVRAVAAHLEGAGYTPVLESADALACGIEPSGVPRSEIGAPGLAVALGGDGTILKAVHLLGASDVPVLGVNMGRLGFLCGADGDGLIDAVDTALAGEGRIERRQTVEARVAAGGRDAGTYRALNEVFVGRGGGARVVEFDVRINGEPVGRYLCDGVILATPTGSTAYALSAGGPLVSPDVRGILVVPVAPHTLAQRPILTGPADVVSISCPNPVRADACVAVDGDHLPCRTSLDSVDVRVGEHDARLLKLDGRDFYGVLSQTFLGG